MDKNKRRREWYHRTKEQNLVKKYFYFKTRDSGLYSRYISMKARCNYKTNNHYKNYGGRGIKILWKSYTDFKKDMFDTYIEHLKNNTEWQTTIERVDVNGHYCKDNCIWVTRKYQASNKRNTLYLEYRGTKQRIRDLYKSSATISYMAFKHRLLSLGWSVEKALTEPRIK